MIERLLFQIGLAAAIKILALANPVNALELVSEFQVETLLDQEVVSVAFSSDHKRIVLAAANGEIKELTIHSGEVSNEYQVNSRIISVAVSPNGKNLAILSEYTLELRNINSGTLIWSLDTPSAKGSDFATVSFSTDGSAISVFVPQWHDLIRLFDAEAGVRRLPGDYVRLGLPFPNFDNDRLKALTASEGKLAPDTLRNSATAISADKSMFVTVESGERVKISLYARLGAKKVVSDRLKRLSGEEKLRAAMSDGDIEAFGELATLEAILNSSSNPPLLHQATEFNSPGIIHLLIERGALLNELEKETGWTALMTAAASGKVDAVVSLLNFGAATDVIGYDGNTFISLLINSSIDAEGAHPAAKLKGQLLETFNEQVIDIMLIEASSKADKHLIHTLLSLGANPNHLGDEGVNAFMLAGISGDTDALEIMKALVLHGADPDFANATGQTALALAIAANSNHEILRYLISITDLRPGKGESVYWKLAKSLDNERALQLLPQPVFEAPNLTFPEFPKIKLELSNDMDRQEIMEVQLQLKRIGLYPGEIDGLWGVLSWRGLGSYFKVIFDEYSSVLNQFCGEILRDVQGKKEAGLAVTGNVTADGVQWYYHDLREFIPQRFSSQAYKDGNQAVCEFERRNSSYVLTEASYTVDKFSADWDKTIRIDYHSRCSRDKNWTQARYLVGGKSVAFDFSCSKTVAGIPVKNNAASSWITYN